MANYGRGPYGDGSFGAGVSLCTADFEAGTNGNGVTTGDAGSSTAWDAVNITSGTITYSNAQAASGSQSCLFSSNTSAHYLEWSTALGTVTDHYGRMYL